MKKLLAFLLAVGLVACPARSFAGSAQNDMIEPTLLDDSPTSITGARFIGGAERVGFFVHYDETQVGNSISLAVTCHVSDDNSTWIAGSFFDFAGGATLQTSETISADGDYFFWLDPNISAPYVRITLTATNTDADDTALVSCTVSTRQ